MQISGSYVGSLPEFSELIALARQGALRPIPTMPFALDQAEAALSRLEGGKIIGRAILVNG